MRTWWVPAGIGLSAAVSVLVDAEDVVDELGLAVFDVERPTAEPAALGDDHAVGGAVGDVDFGGDGERLVLDVDDAVLRQAAHAGEQQLRVAPDQRRASGELGLTRSAERSSIGTTLYLTASISHSRCSSASISGCSAARSWAWL